MTLYHGDCLIEMSRIADGSVDMVCADLPYGTTNCRWDTVIPFEPLWKHYKRIIKPKGAIVLTASQPFTSALGGSNLPWLKYSWVWEKGRPTDFLQVRHKPLKGFEDVLVFYKNRPTYYPQDTVVCDRRVKNTGTKSRGRVGMRMDGGQSFHRGVSGADASDCYWQTQTGYPRGIITFPQDQNSLHPTQKPVALMEYLIRTYTNEGETVLDNCFGSGTTGVACVNLHREFIGIEKDAEYFNVGKARIAKAERDKSELLIA